MACCPMASSHHLNQCWLLGQFSGIHLRAVSQAVPKLQYSYCIISLKVVLLKLLPHLAGKKEMTSITNNCGRILNISWKNSRSRKSNKNKNTYHDIIKATPVVLVRFAHQMLLRSKTLLPLGLRYRSLIGTINNTHNIWWSNQES